MNLIRHEYRIMGYNLIWLTLLVIGGYSVVIFMVPDHPAFLILIFFEILIPILGSVASGYLLNIEHDPMIENLLTASRPFVRILFTRFSLVIGWLLISSIAYMLILRLTYAEFPLGTMLAALISPLLFLSSFTLFFSIILKSSAVGSMIGAFLWGFELIAYSLKRYLWFEFIFLFDTFYNLDSSFWIANRLTLVISSVLLWMLVWRLAGKRERLLK